MSHSRKDKSFSGIRHYTYPKLHQGKDWYVDFLSFDPVEGRLKRKKYMIPASLSKTEKRKRGAEMVGMLTTNLQRGWNPWAGNQNSRGYTTVDECLDLYMKYVMKKTRIKTQQAYRSRVNMLKKFIDTRAFPIRYIYQYDEAFITEYLDWLYLDHEVSETTRNNYRDWCYGFGEWLSARRFIANNPAAKIPLLREKEKKRKDLTAKMISQMEEYLMDTNRYFLLACYMEYYTFIRPTELSYLKIKDINIKEQSVMVYGEHSKNKRDSKVGLNKKIIMFMIDLGVLNAPGDYYLFGKRFRPSPDRFGPDQFNREWKRMRKELKWSDVYQFYSLKDSGIRDLANSAGVVVARDQARHQDVTTTNRYIQRDRMAVHEETLNFEGSFGMIDPTPDPD